MKWWKIVVERKGKFSKEGEAPLRGFVYAASASSARSMAPHWAAKLSGFGLDELDPNVEVEVAEEHEQTRPTGITVKTIRRQFGYLVEIHHARSERPEIQVRRDTDLATGRFETPKVNVPATGSMEILEAIDLIEILQEAVAICERMEDAEPTIRWTPEQIGELDEEPS